MKTEFTYTNRGPSPWNIVQSNLITLWRDGDTVFFSRNYIGKDGTPSDTPITKEFIGNEANAPHVARMIHWGCCGWSDRGTTELIRIVDEFFRGYVLAVQIGETYQTNGGDQATIQGRIKDYDAVLRPWVWSLQGNWYSERNGAFIDSRRLPATAQNEFRIERYELPTTSRLSLKLKESIQ